MADDAARIGTGGIDDAARFAGEIDEAVRAGGEISNVAIIGANVGDETAKLLLNTEVDNLINNLSVRVDNLTPDQKEKLENMLISTTCWYFTSANEG